jgi:hypothetical protein
MSTKKSDIGNDLESLFKKTIEINTRYFKEGTELVSRMSKTPKSGADLNIFQPEQMASAFTAFARLNLDHYQNVLDLGLKLTRQVVSEPVREDVETDIGKPAFVLSGSATPKRKATLDFLLDNTLNEQVKCQFKNTDYISDTDPDLRYAFHTEFSPQSFMLPPGDSQRVTIEIGVDSDVKPGHYTSRVEVLGFEPLFFLIKLNIPENPTKKAGNGKKKSKK